MFDRPGSILTRRHFLNVVAPAVPGAALTLAAGPDLASEARRLLRAYVVTKARADRMGAACDAMLDAEASYEDQVRAQDRFNERFADQLAVEHAICNLVLSTLGRSVPTDTLDWPPVALQVDGWMFIVGPSARPGEAICEAVIPPADVVAIN